MSSEVEKFKEWAGTWWDPHGPMALLHSMTPWRVKFILDCMSTEEGSAPLKNLRVLDVGCGGGLLSEALSRLGANVTGLDPTAELIQAAQAHAQKEGLCITYLHGHIEDLPKETPLFDLIVASEVIEHVPYPDIFLKKCHGFLSETGGLFVSTINRTAKSYLAGILMAEYLLRWVPPGTHTWQQFVKPRELEVQFLKLGLKNQRFQGLSYCPLSSSWGFSSSLDINFFAFASPHKKGNHLQNLPWEKLSSWG